MSINWNSNEDEILKISVLKFGLNNWGKVSSCFFRRTPLNCKMRWYNWVDYRIKKSPWEEGEDIRLIFLEKKFKLNWKVISFFLRRSATQSLFRKKLFYWVKKFFNWSSARNTSTLGLVPNKVSEVSFNKNQKTDKNSINNENKGKKKISELKIRFFNTNGKKSMEKKAKILQINNDGLKNCKKIQKRVSFKRKKHLLFEDWILNRVTNYV